MKKTRLNKPKKLNAKDLEISKPIRSTQDSLKPKKRKELTKWLIEKKDKDNSWT